MWYVAKTAVGAEYDAAAKCRMALDGSADECGRTRVFTPACERVKRYQGAWHTAMSVMFPGYIFVDSDMESERLEKLLWRIPDVLTPVTIGGGFNPITDEEESFYRRMMDADSVIRMSTGFIVDGRLIITRGPLEGKTSLVTHIDRHKRTADVEVSLWREARSVKMGLEVTERK